MASSGRDFDPRTRAFSDEELKPQPMIKKSRKQVNEVSALIIPSGMLQSACGVRRHLHHTTTLLYEYTLVLALTLSLSESSKYTHFIIYYINRPIILISLHTY